MTNRKYGEMMGQDDAYFRALVDSIRDYAIFRLAGDGHVTSWNPGAQWIKGYKADEIIGKHFSCFYPDQAVADGQPARALTQAFEQGRFQEETMLLRKGKMPFWADVVLTSLKNVPDHWHGFALVVCDITARKEAEEERERLILELKTTLDNVKILSGLLPICASCKKIRDYKGQWHPLEVYLRNHSEATLTHEFCVECATNIQSASMEAG
jgi:PAS domain S-box-containing protein